MKKALSKITIFFLTIIFSLILIIMSFITTNVNSLTDDYFNETTECFSKSDDYLELPIIMYHSILKNSCNVYTTKLSSLEKDFNYIKEHGYTPIVMTELIDYVKHDGELPQKPIMITLDDGFYNNYVYVFPLLKKFNFKAVISVVGAFTELNSPGESQNANYSYLNWEQISEMGNSGFVEIQNHTYNLHLQQHRQCGISKAYNESVEDYKNRLTHDITKLQKLLNEKSGICPNTFTYPFGIYNKTAENLISNLGFDAMLTCSEGINSISKNCSLKELKRFNRSGDISTENFFSKRNIL